MREVEPVDLALGGLVGSQDSTNQYQEGQKAILVDWGLEQNGDLVDRERVILLRQRVHHGRTQAQEDIAVSIFTWAGLEVAHRRGSSLRVSQATQPLLNFAGVHGRLVRPRGRAVAAYFM